MKRLLSLMMIAAMLLTVSCKKTGEEQSFSGPKAKVTFTVDAGDIATRAVSGTHGTATRLQVLVYLIDGEGFNFIEAISKTGDTAIEVAEWPTTVSLDLARNETYKIVFWADEGADAYYINIANGTVAEKATTFDGNLTNRDAYYKMIEVTPTGTASESVLLVRPLAQVNVGTSDLDQYKASANYTGNIETKVVVKGVAPGLNLLTGAATTGDAQDLTFGYAASLEPTLVSNSVNYSYLALNYVLCPADATVTADISIRKAAAEDNINAFTVSNMPIKPNYRTNVVGKLLTGTATYTVDVDSDFNNDAEKAVAPVFANIAALNTYFASKLATGPLDADNGDIFPEQVVVEEVGEVATITLPNDTLSVAITILKPYDAEAGITIAYPTAEGAKHSNNVYFNMAGLKKLTANLPDTHMEVTAGADIDLADVHTSTSTFVVRKGARVGTLNVQQGNANVAGEVETLNVPVGATADGTNPVEVFLEKDAAVEHINLNAPANVVVEQPADNIDVEATEKKVSVDVNVNDCSATAQNGGQIYVNVAAGVSLNVAADGTSGEGEESVPSTITIATAGEGAVVEANESNGGKVVSEPEAAGAVKFYVAQIVGGAKYESLYDAVAAAEAGATVKMIDNSTETKGFTLTKSLTIDLSEFTVTYDSSAGTEQFPNTRAIKIAGTEAINVTIKNGTIAIQNNIYGPFRFENENADIVLNDLVLNNGMAYGLGIKLVSANSLTMEDCTVNSVVGGGLEQNYACDVTISDCVFNQTELDTQHPWISSAVSVCYDGYIEIDSGSYSGYTAAFVFSSGGMINISGGTFVGRDAAINVENNTWEPGYAASSEVNISGGSFTGPLKVSGWGGAGTAPVSALNISGGTFTAEPGKLFYTNPGTISITGGTFSEDPSAYVEDGYIVINNGDGTWTVVEDAVAQIGTKTYGTLAKAFAAVKANEEIVVLKNCEVKDHIDVDKSPVTLNLNGFTVKNSVTEARMLDVTAYNGQFTIKGNGKIYIDANQNVTSYGFVRLAGYGSKFILDHAELEGVTENAALLRFNNGGQSMEIKNNSKLTLTAGPNVENKGRGTIIYNNGTNNTLSITDTDIYNYCEAPQWSAMIAMANRSCTFENVRYYSETGPTGFYTGAATYTNCSIELQRTGTLNIDWSYPWLMSAVSTSNAKEVTINSGTYKGYYGIFVYSSGGAITVKGGTFEGTKAVIISENNTWEPGYAGASSINIEDGDFTGQIQAAGWGAAGTSPVAAINISGGKFKVAGSDALFTPNNASILVSGGVFSQDPTTYLKTGYKVIANTDANADVYPYKVVAE